MTHKPEKSPHELTETEMLDPHGNVKHEHVILSVPLLLSVLIALLVLTILTVAASRAETAISAQLNIVIPQWVNVLIAMSIAVVKAVIVAMFFMQLKYDNKLNAVVVVVCLGCVGLFLGFSAVDLGYRGIINPIEQHDIQPGGTGIKGSRTPVIEVARQNEMERVIAEEGVAAWEAMVAEHHGDAHGHEAAHWSSSQKSRPQHGPTGLFDGGSEH
jgi:cytochrome c oxidase subunit IV